MGSTKWQERVEGKRVGLTEANDLHFQEFEVKSPVYGKHNSLSPHTLNQSEQSKLLDPPTHGSPPLIKGAVSTPSIFSSHVNAVPVQTKFNELSPNSNLSHMQAGCVFTSGYELYPTSSSLRSFQEGGLAKWAADDIVKPSLEDKAVLGPVGTINRPNRIKNKPKWLQGFVTN